MPFAFLLWPAITIRYEIYGRPLLETVFTTGTLLNMHCNWYHLSDPKQVISHLPSLQKKRTAGSSVTLTWQVSRSEFLSYRSLALYTSNPLSNDTRTQTDAGTLFTWRWTAPNCGSQQACLPVSPTVWRQASSKNQHARVNTTALEPDFILG